MDNRFGVKDFFLFCILLALIVVVVLAMKQYDRQYQVLRQIADQNGDIRNALLHGASIGQGNGSGTADAGLGQGVDPFADLRALRNDGKYNQGDWLVQSFPAQVAKITPLLGTDLYSYVIWSRVMETLAYQDTDTLEWKPLLATSWNIDDNTAAWKAYVDQHTKAGEAYEKVIADPACPPAATIDFTLRKGVTFSDGSPFGADDVIFTYDWIQNPKVDAPRFRQGFDRVKDRKKINDYEVQFTLKEPFYLGFENLVTTWIMSQKFYSQYSAEKFNDSVGLLIGTGPYRMATADGWKPAPGKIELFRNERYWGLPPSFDRMVFHQVESDSTSMVMYGNGELDQYSIQPQQFKLLQKNSPDIMNRSNSLIYSDPLGGYYFIGWNQQRNGKPTIFADKRVRQAMTMLANREGICQKIFLGYADPAPGPYEAESKLHDPALVDWKYDLNAAKALLKEAGFEDRGKGVLETADGTPFTFKLTYPTKNETVQQTMEFIRDSYAAAGINMILDGVDWVVIDGREKSRDFDAITMGWGGGSFEDDIYQMFDSSQIQDQGDNFTNYSDPALDTAIRTVRGTLDPAKRLELWHQCERILHDDQPYTFLFDRKVIRLFDKRIQNVKTDAAGMNLIQDRAMPFPWYVPVSGQKYHQQ